MENNSKKQTNVSTGSSKRLEELLLHLKMSYNKFAKEIGLKDNVKVYHIKNGRNEISADLANAITATFPQVSYQWLLTGNGEMLVQNTPEEEPEEETYLRSERNRYSLSLQRIQELTNLPMKKLKAYDNGDEDVPDDILEAFENLFQRIENEYNDSEEQDDTLPVLITDEMVSNVKVPFYEVDFTGGFTSPEMFSEVKPSFVISSPSFAGADFACVLIGNSMSRRIKNGSVIGLKKIEDWWEYFPTNEIYAVVTKNWLRTVKIVKRSKKEGYIDLIPDPLPEYNNPEYETETIRVDYVLGFYKVIAHAFFERMSF